MAGPPPTELPEDPAAAELGSGAPAADVVRAEGLRTSVMAGRA